MEGVENIRRKPLASEAITGFDTLMSNQDVLIAGALAAFRIVGRQVTAALRRDDIVFFQNLLAEGADLLGPQDVKRFWSILRRSLPKFKQRRLHLAPANIEALEHQMLPHLCQPEQGTVITPAELLSDCHQRQLTTMNELQGQTVVASSLPSLSSFETALRATKPDKATGLDPIPSRVQP